MRTYAAWLNGRCVGTIQAPGYPEASRLGVAMWGDLRMQETTELPAWAVYDAMGKDAEADSAGREAEIMYRIGRDAR